jgi:hypothetical protein
VPEPIVGKSSIYSCNAAERVLYGICAVVLPRNVNVKYPAPAVHVTFCCSLTCVGLDVVLAPVPVNGSSPLGQSRNEQSIP